MPEQENAGAAGKVGTDGAQDEGKGGDLTVALNEARGETKTVRKALTEANTELEELRAWKEEREQAELTEQQKLQKERDRLKSERDNALAEAKAAEARSLVRMELANHQLRDGAAKYALAEVDLAAVTEENVAEVVSDVLTANPLFVDEGAQGAGRVRQVGGAPGGGGNQGTDMSAWQQQAEAFLQQVERMGRAR